MRVFNEWVAAERGRQVQLARALKVGPSLVQYWREVGRIPSHHLSAVSKVTGIPVERLLPSEGSRS